MIRIISDKKYKELQNEKEKNEKALDYIYSFKLKIIDTPVYLLKIINILQGSDKE